MRRLIEDGIIPKSAISISCPTVLRPGSSDVYGGFVPVYTEMIRIRENQHRDWRPANSPIHPDMVEDMLHFFSDYQHLTRAFKRLNRGVEILMADRQA